MVVSISSANAMPLRFLSGGSNKPIGLSRKQHPLYQYKVDALSDLRAQYLEPKLLLISDQAPNVSLRFCD